MDTRHKLAWIMTLMVLVAIGFAHSAFQPKNDVSQTANGFVFHDLNGNQNFDRGLFGLPAEPYGFSNTPVNKLRPPDFGSASFEFSGRDLSIEVTLRSLPF